mmetsp:Transcript_50979/g.141096  ORF Transcript_50979/g.141096 Transcript_50979/m.141096 type:complete len:214 (-) Transcript_50979:1050-1691(-)
MAGDTVSSGTTAGLAMGASSQKRAREGSATAQGLEANPRQREASTVEQRSGCFGRCALDKSEEKEGRERQLPEQDTKPRPADWRGTRAPRCLSGLERRCFMAYPYLRARAVMAPRVSAGCSFMESANCSGCCCLRSTTSFQSSRSCFTRSSCDSMCCCEICSRRRTLWSAFLAIMSKMLRKRCEHRCRHALSTRKDMFSAHSSQPSSSTSASP